MGQYRPSSLIPSTLTSEYSIDATKVNVFSCKLNGTSPTIKYRLKIMNNNTTSSIVYDTGVVSLSKPIYPVNSDGTENLLQVSVPSSSGMVNGKEYKWSISSYWSANEYYESYDNVFKTYKDASISIVSYPNPLTEKSYTFQANIVKPSDVGIERFGWIIQNIESGDQLVNTIDSGNIYSSEVEVYYDGFLNDEMYEVKVKAWLMNGTSVETDFQPIAVSYMVAPVDSAVVATPLKNSGVLVQWAGIYYIFGKIENNAYSFVTEEEETFLRIRANNSLTFDTITGTPIELPTTVTHTFSFFCNTDNNKVYRADGIDKEGNPYFLQVSVAGEYVRLNVNGNLIPVYKKQSGDTFVIMSIENTRIRIRVWGSLLDGLYPETQLWPSQTLYPRDETYEVKDVQSVENSIITDGTWNKFTFSGPVDLKFFWIRVDPVPQNIWSQLGTKGFLPEWDVNTRILATFQNTFSAGNVFAPSEVFSWMVYSRDLDSTSLKFIRENEKQRTYLVDYTARNMNGIEYWVFPVFEFQIGNPNVSNRVSPDWWSWDLIVADKYGNDQYYVSDVFRFDLDVTSGQLSNNTAHSILQNFTNYSKVQSSNANYWSGRITSLLGNCADEYVDTVERMEDLKRLTTDGKDKFLKDRKGNFWKIRLNAPVTESMNDAYVEQAVTVQISWMEIGSSALSSVTENLDVTLEELLEDKKADNPTGAYALQEKQVTPTKFTQNISPDRGYYGLSSVKVDPIPSEFQNVSAVTASPQDVREGKVIVTSNGLVVQGTAKNVPPVSVTLNTFSPYYDIQPGFHSTGGQVKIDLESKTVTPTQEVQHIVPTNGMVLGSVDVEAVPPYFADNSKVNATADEILVGKIIVNADGEEVVGTMPDNSPGKDTLLTNDEKSYTIPLGYHDGTGKVYVETEDKTVDPDTEESIVVTASEGKFLGTVTVNPGKGGGDVSGVTANPEDVLVGKKYVKSDGELVDGTMPNNGQITGTIIGLIAANSSYTIPVGYTSGGTVSLTDDIYNALDAI